MHDASSETLGSLPTLAVHRAVISRQPEGDIGHGCSNDSNALFYATGVGPEDMDDGQTVWRSGRPMPAVRRARCRDLGTDCVRCWANGFLHVCVQPLRLGNQLRAGISNLHDIHSGVVSIQ